MFYCSFVGYQYIICECGAKFTDEEGIKAHFRKKHADAKLKPKTEKIVEILHLDEHAVRDEQEQSANEAKQDTDCEQVGEIVYLENFDFTKDSIKVESQQSDDEFRGVKLERESTDDEYENPEPQEAESPEPSKFQPDSPKPSKFQPDSPEPSKFQPDSPEPSKFQPDSPEPSQSQPDSPEPSQTYIDYPEPPEVENEEELTTVVNTEPFEDYSLPVQVVKNEFPQDDYVDSEVLIETPVHYVLPNESGVVTEFVLQETEFQYKCEACNILYADENAYKMHLQVVHLKGRARQIRLEGVEPPPPKKPRLVKKRVCEVCGKKYTSNAALGYHQRIHTGEKPFQCKTCPKAFSMPLFLTIHERIHTGERPFPCKLCPKAFSNKAALNRHDRVHTGEKPYACPECNKCFSQSNSMKLHLMTVHLKMPAPYKSKKRQMKDAMNKEKHVKIVYKEEVSD